MSSRVSLQAVVDSIAADYLQEWAGLGVDGTFADARIAATLALLISQPG